MACYIYQLPSWVLDDLCRNMDALSEWDWMEFASYVITDLTQLRKIKSMERVQGVSITRELLWWWGMRQATVQQLVDLLCRLELYRAAQIILNWKPAPEIRCPIPAFPDSVKPEKPLAASVRKAEDEQEEGQPVRMATFPGPGSSPAGAHQPAFLQPPEEDAPHSLRSDLPTSSDSKDFSTSIPKQEKLLSLAGDSLFWSEADVVQATDDFNQNHKISQGTFADVYRGHRHGKPFVFKKLRETACSSPGSIERFFQAELQICLRCCHPNVLPVLGFCAARQFHSFIYPYMANGSLQDRLQGQGGSDPLPWPQRVSICSGLLCAVEYLHGLEIIHSNVKKDLLLSEIPSSTASLCSRKTGVENVMAKEICQKYLEKGAGRLPEDCAEALATAACLCLRRRNTSLQEVCGSVAAVEERLRGRETLLPWSGLSEGTGSSSNTPEETDDVDNSSLVASSSMSVAPWAGAATPLLPTENGEGRLRVIVGREADSSSEACVGPEPPQDVTETSWQIEINEAKRKLMENILLYKEEKLDSIELFGP
uniref:Interleukin-1 receptor-associated kinase-like 2 n=1 Tax=Gorilla gorilla gorilla TaxID=9595 RepID=G3QHL6_GORGO